MDERATQTGQPRERVGFVTLNDVTELTGGGLYSRNILHNLKDAPDLVVIHKAGPTSPGLQGTVVAFRKTTFADLLSRALLTPTFLGAYALKVVRTLRGCDRVVIQNTRNGGLAALIKRSIGAKITLYVDNIQGPLVRRYVGKTVRRRLFIRVETVLCTWADRLSFRAADEVVFLTERDRRFARRYYGVPYSRSRVEPIRIPPPEVTGSVETRSRSVLFTGTFTFWPNHVAGARVLDIARRSPDCHFFLAGIGIADRYEELPPNVVVHESPERDQLDELFAAIPVYLAPNDNEGGMKTKVALALSFNQSVLGYPGALMGYEATVGSRCVYRVSRIEEVVEMLTSDTFWLEVEQARAAGEASAVYDRHYRL